VVVVVAAAVYFLFAAMNGRWGGTRV